MTGAARVEVVRVDTEHLPALTEFYRRVWDPSATLGSVKAARVAAAANNPVTPGAAPPTWLVLQGGDAIAHVTSIPISLWARGRECPAYWIKGLWVLPEFQRSGAGFLVLRATASVREPSLALVHEPAAIRLFQALGYTDLGALPNRLRILSVRSVLARVDLDAMGLGGLSPWMRYATRWLRPAAVVLSPLLGAGNEMWAAIASGRLGPFTVDVTAECDRNEVEGLWCAVRDEIEAGPARDGAELCRRYSRDDGYLFVHVRSRAGLVGLGVVKRPREHGDPRLRGIRVATLSDLLYRPSEPRTGLAVLRGAERAARSLGADALLCSAGAKVVEPALRRRGYFRLPSNLHVLARSPDDEALLPTTLDAWWVTRGDSGGDGVF